MKVLPKTKKAMITCLAVTTLATAGIGAAYAATTFTDLDGKWYKNSVLQAYDRGLVNGVGNGKYQGDRYITRGEMSVVANHLYDKSASETDALKERVAQLEAVNKTYGQAIDQLEKEIADLKKDAASVPTNDTPAPSPTPAPTQPTAPAGRPLPEDQIKNEQVPQGDGVVNLDKFKAIKLGYTLEQVTKLIGKDGVMEYNSPYVKQISWRASDNTQKRIEIQIDETGGVRFAQQLYLDDRRSTNLYQDVADRIKLDMTYQQVRDMIGDEGVLYSFGTEPIYGTTYSWMSADGSARLFVKFMGGKVNSWNTEGVLKARPTQP